MTPRVTPGRLLVALLVAVTVMPLSGAGASCVAPSLVVPERVYAPAARTVFSGQLFLDGCDDTSTEDTFGCSAEPPEQAAPMNDVELVLRQGERRWSLGTADAEEGGNIRWSTALPRDLRQGRAELVAGPANSEIIIGP